MVVDSNLCSKRAVLKNMPNSRYFFVYFNYYLFSKLKIIKKIIYLNFKTKFNRSPRRLQELVSLLYNSFVFYVEGVPGKKLHTISDNEILNMYIYLFGTLYLRL